MQRFFLAKGNIDADYVEMLKEENPHVIALLARSHIVDRYSNHQCSADNSVLGLTGAGPVIPDLKMKKVISLKSHRLLNTNVAIGGRGGSIGRASASRSNGLHDQRFESRPEHKTNL